MQSTTNAHPFSSSCGYCDTIYTFQEPFQYNYLFYLFTAPNLSSCLTKSIPDELYALPFHIQQLIMEARKEILSNTMENRAQTRLERLKLFVWQRSNGDMDNIMSVLTEFITNEELVINFS